MMQNTMYESQFLLTDLTQTNIGLLKTLFLNLYLIILITLKVSKIFTTFVILLFIIRNMYLIHKAVLAQGS